MEVAVEFETDWTLWSVVIAGLLAVAAVTWSGLAVTVGTLAEDAAWLRPRWVDVLGWVLWVAVSLGALGVLLILPGQIMRHLPVHAMVWWVLLGCVLALALLVIWGYRRDASVWEIWIPAGTLAVGFILGWIVDSLTRAASSVPISLGGGALIIILIVAWIMSSDRR